MNIVLAVISNPDPPNLDAEESCCIDGIELPPPDSCESPNDPFFGLHNDGYCEDKLLPQGGIGCRTSNDCDCSVGGLQTLWTVAICAGAPLRPSGELQDRCCRSFMTRSCHVWDGKCLVGPGESPRFPEEGETCTGCFKKLQIPQPLVPPMQADVISCDPAKAVNCCACPLPEPAP